MTKNKPPLGVMPEYLYQEELEKLLSAKGGISWGALHEIRCQRIGVLGDAMKRYIKTNFAIPVEWVVEYNKLQNESKNHLNTNNKKDEEK